MPCTAAIGCGARPTVERVMVAWRPGTDSLGRLDRPRDVETGDARILRGKETLLHTPGDVDGRPIMVGAPLGLAILFGALRRIARHDSLLQDSKSIFGLQFHLAIAGDRLHLYCSRKSPKRKVGCRKRRLRDDKNRPPTGSLQLS